MYFMLFCTLVIAMSEAKQPYVSFPVKLISLMIEKSPECIKETGARPDILQQFFSIPLEKEETSKKFNFCLFKKIGLSDDYGHFYVDKVVNLFENSSQKESDMVAKTIEGCNQIVDENPFETMYQSLLCFGYGAPAWVPPRSERHGN